MFYVSRQKYYYSGINAVEIANGGQDLAGSDMLVPKYQGEGQEYADPREAVEAAINICRAWRKDGTTSAKLVMGSTLGMGIELEPITFEDAEKLAEKLHDKLPKCDQCGAILGKERFKHVYDCDDLEFCSEQCAEANYYDSMDDCEDDWLPRGDCRDREDFHADG